MINGFPARRKNCLGTLFRMRRPWPAANTMQSSICDCFICGIPPESSPALALLLPILCQIIGAASTMKSSAVLAGFRHNKKKRLLAKKTTANGRKEPLHMHSLPWFAILYQSLRRSQQEALALFHRRPPRHPQCPSYSHRPLCRQPPRWPDGACPQASLGCLLPDNAFQDDEIVRGGSRWHPAFALMRGSYGA